jgi:hypothetical protein
MEVFMASGSNVHVGSIKGTGAAIDVVCPFRPCSVDLYTSGGIEGHWNSEMADASAFKRIANGTGSVVSSAGITPSEDGFQLGTDAGLNVNGATIYFVAKRA